MTGFGTLDLPQKLIEHLLHIGRIMFDRQKFLLTFRAGLLDITKILPLRRNLRLERGDFEFLLSAFLFHLLKLIGNFLLTGLALLILMHAFLICLLQRFDLFRKRGDFALSGEQVGRRILISASGDGTARVDDFAVQRDKTNPVSCYL